MKPKGNKVSKAQEDRQRKAEEKERNEKFKWVLKRLAWETTLKESLIVETFGQRIKDLIALGKNDLAICSEIKVRIQEGSIC